MVNENKPEETKLVRTLFELPQLVEVMARDNHKSYCISIDFQSEAIYGKNNYVCSDNGLEKLYVKFKNPNISNRKDNYLYISEKYFVK